MNNLSHQPTPVCLHCGYEIQMEKDFWFCEKCFFCLSLLGLPRGAGFCKNCGVKDDDLECPKCFQRSNPWDWFPEGDEAASEIRKALE